MHFKCDQHFDISTSEVHCREHCPLTGFGHAIVVDLGYRCTQAWPPLPFLFILISISVSMSIVSQRKTKLETPETDSLDYEVHLGTLPLDNPQLAAGDCRCVFQSPQDLAGDRCIMKLSSQKWPGGIGGYQTSSPLPARDTFTL